MTTKKKASRPQGKLQGLHLHFDPLSGIAGDMTVAALVDLGVPESVVTGAVKAIKVPGLKVGFEKRKRGAFAGLGFLVDWPGKDQGHVHEHPHARAHQHHQHDHDHDHDHHHDHDHDHEHHHDHDHDHQQHDHRDWEEIQRLLTRAALGAETKRLALEIFERIAVVEAKSHGVPVKRVTF